MQTLMSGTPVRAPAEQVETYRFGAFLLDVRHRALIHGREARPLTEKAFHILKLLLEADGRLVRKEEFFAEVWPGDVVSDANLTQQIFILRGMLRQGARDNSHIVTVHGQGYRLGFVVEKKAGLAMKQTCERCARLLEANADARICSYECTFCADCANRMGQRCPNCGGELVARPRRLSGEPSA